MNPVNTSNIDPYVLAQAIQMVQNGQVNVWHRGIQLPNGGMYDGEMQNNVPHGKGNLKYKRNGEADEKVSYEGDFIDGKRHGSGVMIWADGNRYEGEYNDDKMTGRGIMKYGQPGFVSYEGTYVDGVQHGFGTMIWTDGDRYEGEWKEGEMTGNGTMKFADGSCYTGNWEKGVVSGQGTKTYKDIQNGYTVNHEVTGIWKKGEIWEGKHIKNGRTTYAFKNGKSVAFVDSNCIIS